MSHFNKFFMALSFFKMKIDKQQKKLISALFIYSSILQKRQRPVWPIFTNLSYFASGVREAAKVENNSQQNLINKNWKSRWSIEKQIVVSHKKKEEQGNKKTVRKWIIRNYPSISKKVKKAMTRTTKITLNAQQ